MLRCPEYGVFLSMRHFTSPNGGQDNGKQCIIQFPSFPDSSQCLCVRVCRYVSYISVCNLYICVKCALAQVRRLISQRRAFVYRSIRALSWPWMPLVSLNWLSVMRVCWWLCHPFAKFRENQLLSIIMWVYDSVTTLIWEKNLDLTFNSLWETSYIQSMMIFKETTRFLFWHFDKIKLTGSLNRRVGLCLWWSSRCLLRRVCLSLSAKYDTLAYN